MSRDRPLGARHTVAVAVALGLPLGAGVFALLHRVESLGGPATPVAYVVGTLAVCTVAVAYAVYLSSPLAERDGVVYAVVLARVSPLDPAASLGFTRWEPALAVVDEALLVRDPLATAVPAVLLWELVGVAIVAVAADHRADRGVERPPLAAACEE